MYHSNKSNNGSKPVNRERPCGVHIDCILHVGDFAGHLCTCTCQSLCSNRVKECKSHTQKREKKQQQIPHEAPKPRAEFLHVKILFTR